MKRVENKILYNIHNIWHKNTKTLSYITHYLIKSRRAFSFQWIIIILQTSSTRDDLICLMYKKKKS